MKPIKSLSGHWREIYYCSNKTNSITRILFFNLS